MGIIKDLVDSGQRDVVLAMIRGEKEALQAFFRDRNTSAPIAVTAMLEAIAEHALVSDDRELILATAERFIVRIRELTKRSRPGAG